METCQISYLSFFSFQNLLNSVPGGGVVLLPVLVVTRLEYVISFSRYGYQPTEFQSKDMISKYLKLVEKNVKDSNLLSTIKYVSIIKCLPNISLNFWFWSFFELAYTHVLENWMLKRYKMQILWRFRMRIN